MSYREIQISPDMLKMSIIQSNLLILKKTFLALNSLIIIHHQDYLFPSLFLLLKRLESTALRDAGLLFYWSLLRGGGMRGG